MNSKLDDIIRNLNNTTSGTSFIHTLSAEDSGQSSSKIYDLEEAGDYVEINYKGITVYVRENYPYYNPQNDKIYYSKEEEAEELYQLSKDMSKSSIDDLDL